MDQQTAEKFKKYISTGADDELSQISGIWRDFFSQRTTDAAEFDTRQMQNFLSTGSSMATGTGKMNTDPEAIDRAYIEQLADKALFEEFPASTVGNPETIEVFGIKTSLASTWNLLRFATYYRTLVSAEMLPNGSLDLVEVGPGYGCAAYFWIQTGRVRSYTLVDLKENLCNSLYYLSENFPEWTINLVDKNNPITFKDKTFNFSTPDRLQDFGIEPNFDVAVNSDSFGEMPELVAQSYIRHLQRWLRPGGIFISLNGHRRGETELMGVSRPSDYGYERFAIEHFAYKPFCSFAFEDFGHLAIMRNNGQTDSVRLRMIDTLANLFALGINIDLDDLLARLDQEKLTGEDEQALEAFAAAFTGSDRPYEGPMQYEAVLEYVRLGRSVYGSLPPPGEQFLDAAQNLTSKEAILFCHAFYFILTGKMAKNVTELKNDPVFRFLFQSLDQIDRLNPFAKKLALQVRKEHLRKKFFPIDSYSPSTLLLAKNWFSKTRLFVQRYY